MNKKGPMSSNRALRRAKRMQQSKVLVYIDPFFRSNCFFHYRNGMVLSTKKLSIMRVKRGNPISSKDKCLKIANIGSTYHLEYS